MTIDKYRLNWRAINDRKQAIDDHNAQYRQGERPPIGVDMIVFVFVVAVVCALLVFLKGYADGRAEARTVAKRVEYVSPATRCTSWDFGGPGGTKRCMVWRRVL